MLCNVEISLLLLILGALVVGPIRSWKAAGWTAAAVTVVATAIAWTDAVRVLSTGKVLYASVAHLPRFGSELAVHLDRIGAGFLLLTTAIPSMAAVFSIGYMGRYTKEHPGRFYCLFQLFTASMMGVVSVADWLFFIAFWELMTLASYFLVVFERDEPAVARAGFKYFVMTHVATAGLLVAAVALWRATDSFAFDNHARGLADAVPTVRHILLALYLLAFATKAGLFPMGDWARDAYPAAPSSVSAVMSGITSKLGIYGVFRVFHDALPVSASRTELLVWGIVITALGVVSALVTGLRAMQEGDTKRLLAFSSMSQAGYIFLALGIGVAFSGPGGLPAVALVAFLGAGFHILNDALYKSLLFMNAGSVLYATGLRDLNKVGGLLSVMPVTAAAGLVGVLSLSGIPPTNGFVSKWLIYQASISGGIQFAPFLVAAVAAFFVSLSTLGYSLRYCCTAFLGKLAPSREELNPVPKTMTAAQGVLSVVCLVIGLSPYWVVSGLNLIFDLQKVYRVGAFGSLVSVGADGQASAAWNPIGLLIALVVCVLIAEAVRRLGGAAVRTVPTWYGGEEHPDDEVRFRAHGLYSPFNAAFSKVYPTIPLPQIGGTPSVRAVLDIDRWLFNPLVKIGADLVSAISRTHVGTPQLYLIWQVVGMAVVLAVLLAVVR
ncbi:MAG: proton-conducting transporter membrane subunit [Armatimonadota bacterium]